MAPRDRTALIAALGVYLVADPDHTDRDLVEDVRLALAGGVTCIQLRVKTRTDREALLLARSLRAECRTRNAVFIVNDRVDLALATDADGVHLGVDDLPVAEARRLLPLDWVIGYSPETDDQARNAAADGADYLGVGPVFGTRTKLNAGQAIGLATLERRVRLAGIPVIGIGGVTSGNAREVISAGAVGVAVTGAILRAADPASAARDLANAVNQAKAPPHA